MWCKDFDIFQVWRTGENFSLTERLRATEDLNSTACYRMQEDGLERSLYDE